LADLQGKRASGPDQHVSVPWVESPFFGRELALRTDLTPTEKQLAQHFHDWGYVVVPGVVDDEHIERVKSEVVGLFDPDVKEGFRSYYRVHEAWQSSSAVKELAFHERVLSVLRLLYGREPVPFQTLNFLYGSQQANHSDAILFNSLPARFMCGVWVALEDTDPENGPLFYHPGSQSLKEYYLQDFASAKDGEGDFFFGHRYPFFIRDLMETYAFRREELYAKRGDVLIWASNLVHGGSKRLHPTRTRWTQVTHYFFENCIYYVPLYSNTVSGEICLRDVVDLRTGLPCPQSFNGLPFVSTPLGGRRFRISISTSPDAVPPAAKEALEGLGSAKELLLRGRNRLRRIATRFR
jgi:ectoine hydroxylase-related dioxygenase (phytanoyl-CoA dioxygenase family)